MRRWSGLAIAVVASTTLVGCHQSNNSAADDVSYQDVETVSAPPPGDWTGLTYTKSFTALVDQMKIQYAFTDWKAVDFQALQDQYAPEVAKAEQAKDQAGYALALLNFLHSIPDGNIEAVDAGSRTVIKDLRAKNVGGTYGFTVASTESGAVLVDTVTSPELTKAGIKPGAAVARIGAEGISDALNSTPTTWTASSNATREDQLVARLTYLTRGPVGSQRLFGFNSEAEDNAVKEVTLSATDDKTGGLPPNSFNRPRALTASEVADDPINYRKIGSVGYIQIKAMTDPPPADKSAPGTTLINKVGEAITALHKEDVDGFVFDARSNGGGSDQAAAQIPGFWASDGSIFYQYTTGFDSTRVQQVIATSKTLVTDLHAPVVQHPVVVLNNTATAGAGEGLALQTNRMPVRTSTMGFWSTNGSFGISGGIANMPEGIRIAFPTGRSLDINKQIQVVAQGDGNGGLAPEHKVPRNRDNILAVGRGEDPELAAALHQLERAAR